MRLRTLVAAAAAALLLAPPALAHAGSGISRNCSDGIGYREIPIVTDGATLAVEMSHPPGGEYHTLLVCYSTTPPGTPGTVTGGTLAIELRVVRDEADERSPGVYVGIGCYPDFVTGAGPECAFANSVNVTPSDLDIDVTSSACLVSFGAGCLAYIPGVSVKPNQSDRPLVSIEALGQHQSVDLPACVPVVQTC